MVDNELSQLDSSVYTQIFIPSDGELNPSAFKYRDQVCPCNIYARDRMVWVRLSLFFRFGDVVDRGERSLHC